MKSMTAFAEATGREGALAIHVEVRSVNHRYFDLQTRLAGSLRRLEPRVREVVKERVRRGRIDLTVEVQPTSDAVAPLELSEERVASLQEVLRQTRELGVSVGELGAADLLQIPGLISASSQSVEIDEAGERLILATVGEALGLLEEQRGAEGDRLRRALAEHVAALESTAAALRRQRPEATVRMRQRLAAKLQELRLDDLPEERVAQEMALLVERSDVEEELDRLGSHLEALHATIGGTGGSDTNGKRLDFLAQEVLRELNTVAAKCRDLEMTNLVIDAKVVCEQVREQVQNVE